jgi:hypothetical protein
VKFIDHGGRWNPSNAIMRLIEKAAPTGHARSCRTHVWACQLLNPNDWFGERHRAADGQDRAVTLPNWVSRSGHCWKPAR